MGPRENTDVAAVLALFRQICADTATALAANADWGPSGQRDGQYRVDLRLDQLCVHPLIAAGYSVLTEETGFIRTSRGGDRVVVVDPLDGSTNAALGLPWCATALCLVEGDRPAVAVVANLRTGERFEAIADGGAMWFPDGTGEGSPLSLRRRTHGSYEYGRPSFSDRIDTEVQLSTAIIATSGLFSQHWGWKQYRAMGAAALDICSVARGGFDGFVDVDDDAHGVWDYLAAVLVLTEAGGVAADALGRDLVVLEHEARRTPVAASHQALLSELLARR